ncbi:MAG: peptidylprolyl isomerase [Actinomycetota bacterium]|nr:peptidylprolyl isomerase [Actinomycetota bacterium]
MTTAENGSTVSVHYVGTLSSGQEFDSSRNRQEPLTFQVGAGQVIPGFNDAVVGMTVGETKSVTIDPENAYGLLREEAITTVNRTEFPEGFEFTEGGIVQAQNETGTFRGVINSFTDTEVIVDFNHPLAGEALTFEIELVEVQA